MDLLKAWKRASNAPAAPRKEPVRSVLPKAPSYYAELLNFVVTAAGAEAMADLARQRRLSAIGFDFEFQYDSPGVFINKGRTVYPPQATGPSCSP